MREQKSSKNTKQTVKKYLVFAAMAAICLACLWWIFSPSAEERKTAEQGTGFNSTIPDPRNAEIVDDKKTAYEQQLQSLHEELLFGGIDEQTQIRMAPQPVDYSPRPEPVYNEINRTLAQMNAPPQDDTEKEELKAEIERLNGIVERRQSEQDEIALLEHSYRLAAGLTEGPNNPTTPTRNENIEPVTRVSRPVVSSLSAQVPEAGFNTIGVKADLESKNTIAAVIHGDQTITDGRAVRLRTTEPMRAGGRLIPTGTIVVGLGSITADRLEVTITHIGHEGNIIPVEMTVHDGDGQQGIYIPGSMEIDAAKEIGGNMGQSLGTTINLNQQSAGEQLLTDLGRGAIQSASQLIAKKAKQTRVTLKAGHRLLLKPTTNR